MGGGGVVVKGEGILIARGPSIVDTPRPMIRQPSRQLADRLRRASQTKLLNHRYIVRFLIPNFQVEAQRNV